MIEEGRNLALQELWERQHRYLREPQSFFPIFLKPCVVRILMVTDGGGAFGSTDFGLKALLDALATPPGPWVRFEVTKAHRRTFDPTADISDFRFDQHDLNPYDQIWMIAVEASSAPGLAPSELRAIAEFMDNGGGIFATGDHEDLGVAMCGSVPRVRSMRKWHWPNPGPNGEPVAPSVGGPDRFDTLRPGGTPDIQFDDQSDDVPQRISPRMYITWPPNKWFHKSYPHPLLCGPRGVIRVLPDHPHEGECYVPDDLTAAFTFDGYTITEYPGGLRPEVIAWSRVSERLAAEDSHKGALNARRFGAIGAYDGHAAGVGRVVVQATWHHVFNINLIGELGNPDPVKAIGFNASPSGAAAYNDIKVYFRNIAVWLAKPSSQSCMWWRALWWARWNHRLVMDVRRGGLAEATLRDVLFIGGEARDVLGRRASQCIVFQWLGWFVLRPRLPSLWESLQHYLDLWLPSERDVGGRDPDVLLPLAMEMLVDCVLGGLVLGLAEVFPDPTDEARERAETTDFAELLGDYTERVAQLLSEHLTQAGAELQEAGSLLR
jgi:hypothetical protein